MRPGVHIVRGTFDGAWLQVPYARVVDARDNTLHETSWWYPVLRCRLWALARGYGWVTVAP
jgi:hypothetical protein